MNASAKRFEVVYVSSDNDEQAMLGYMQEKHGDWRISFYLAAFFTAFSPKTGAC